MRRRLRGRLFSKDVDESRYFQNNSILACYIISFSFVYQLSSFTAITCFMVRNRFCLRIFKIFNPPTIITGECDCVKTFPCLGDELVSR